MGDLAAELKKLNLVEIQKTIEKGTIVVLKDDEAEKFIKDKNNKTPYFVTTQFRENNLKKFGNSTNEHYWIFLKTYQKRGGSGKVKIVNRSSLREDSSNRKPKDLYQLPHASIDSDHNGCRINKEGLWKAELPKSQKLDKNFLKNITPTSDDFICIDPESEKIADYFMALDKEKNEVYD